MFDGFEFREGSLLGQYALKTRNRSQRESGIQRITISIHSSKGLMYP